MRTIAPQLDSRRFFHPPNNAAGEVQTHEQAPVTGHVFVDWGLQTVGCPEAGDGGGSNVFDNGKEISKSVYTGLVEP